MRRSPCCHRAALAASLLGIGLAFTASASAAPLTRRPPPAERGITQLERSWARLDQELRLLDQLLSPDQLLPQSAAGAGPGAAVPFATPTLLRANRPASGEIGTGAPNLVEAPLALPTAATLAQGTVQSLSLRQALALAYGQSPDLQEQRLEVARSLADLQARLGRYWPNRPASGRSAAIAAAPP